MTREPPWQYEIRQENASPRLRESFVRSARVLLPSLNEPELRFIELSYVNPELEDEPARAVGVGSGALDLVAAANLVPPRGFEPLISTLKGWRPRPLDDGGADAARAPGRQS